MSAWLEGNIDAAIVSFMVDLIECIDFCVTFSIVPMVVLSNNNIISGNDTTNHRVRSHTSSTKLGKFECKSHTFCILLIESHYNNYI